MIRAVRPCVIAMVLAGATASPGGPPAKGEADKIEWLRRNVVPIRSLDAADEDFKDLMPLADKIGSARVVALGEATHGDGSAFRAKARLVRFLHQVMGFDVLAWESPAVACRNMDTALRTSSLSVGAAAALGPYRPWHRAAEVQPVFEYIRATQSTERPLLSDGFDCRLWGAKGNVAQVPEYLFAVFDRADPALLSEQDRADLKAMAAGLDYSSYYHKPGPRHFNMGVPKRLIALLDQPSPKLLARVDRRDLAVARQVLDNLVKFEAWLELVGRDEEQSRLPNRDALMAENLVWLARVRYPDRKIIVWAHNYHVMANVYMAKTDAALDASSSNTTGGPMGMHVRRALGDDYYTVGFIGDRGSWAFASSDEKPETVAPAAEGSLDWWLRQAGHANAFLDLRGLPAGHWLRQPMAARFYFWQPATTVWPRIYDGVVFVETVTPATPVATEAAP